MHNIKWAEGTSRKLPPATEIKNKGKTEVRCPVCNGHAQRKRRKKGLVKLYTCNECRASYVVLAQRWIRVYKQGLIL